MDPSLTSFLNPAALVGLGPFVTAGAMAMLYYYLSATGRIFSRTQHEKVLEAVDKSHDEAMAVLKESHATTLAHFTDRNAKLEGLFTDQQDVIKSQQLVNAGKHEVIAQQSRQIDQLIVVAGTVDDFLKRAPRVEVAE